MEDYQIKWISQSSEYQLKGETLTGGDILEARGDDGNWGEVMFEEANDGYTNEPTFLLCACKEDGDVAFPPVLIPKGTHCRWPQNRRNVRQE